MKSSRCILAVYFYANLQAKFCKQIQQQWSISAWLPLALVHWLEEPRHTKDAQSARVISKAHKKWATLSLCTIMSIKHTYWHTYKIKNFTEATALAGYVSTSHWFATPLSMRQSKKRPQFVLARSAQKWRRGIRHVSLPTRSGPGVRRWGDEGIIISNWSITYV